MLRRAVASALCQNYHNIEIIISDNASTDRTTEVALELCKRKANIIYRREPVNLGPSRNIANALKLAGGEFCYILSDDDFLLPACISTLIAPILNNPKICHSTSYVNECDVAGLKVKSHCYPELCGVKTVEFLLTLSDFREKDKLAVLVYGLTKTSVLRSIHPTKPLRVAYRMTYTGSEPQILRLMLEFGEISISREYSICYTGPGERDGAASYSISESLDVSVLGALQIYIQQLIRLTGANFVSRHSLVLRWRSSSILFTSFILLIFARIFSRATILLSR